MILDFSNNYKGKIFYLGKEFRKKLADKLDYLSKTSVGTFLINNSQREYGANRNLLLLTLGASCFIMTDDDTYPKFILHHTS